MVQKFKHQLWTQFNLKNVYSIDEKLTQTQKH